MGLLFGCLARATGLFFQTPSQQLSSLFHLWECSTFVLGMSLFYFFLGMAHPWWRLWRGSPHPARAVPCLCSAPVHLISLSHIIFATNWSLGPPAVPLQSREQMGSLLSAEECPSAAAAVEGAGMGWSYISGWSSSFWRPGLLPSPAAVQGPLRARVQQPSARAVPEQPRGAGELTEQVTIRALHPSCPALAVQGSEP